MPPGCLSLVVLLALFVLLPLFLADAMLTALSRLGLSPSMSFLVAVSIFLGGTVNIPVKRIPREQLVQVVPTALFGVGSMFPRLVRQRTYAVIAVNVGGCVIPCLLVLYELLRLAGAGGGALTATVAAVLLNVSVCHLVSRPVPSLGVVMPPIVPALVAALSGLVLAREQAPLVAFVAGVLGPLIGADLLRLREIERTTTGLASIGGAGTFDGIVLSGLVATLLA